ncbi:ABC transporter permease [Fulvivirga ulvae]|uniref:ABC transporter permease n=1 Tax=Fulvivirga ulvae TaxID=2904245 RepID=UPI001F16EC16|nr:ABC transporter permease [Fulvivirga ulvae]UII34388.1 ABC transporter permease [Fulvivirga ulvae]
MVRNYIKIALRSLLKNKIYTFINVAGLSIGVASCLMIVINVQDELSYDDFHKDSDQIYKFVLERLYPDHKTNYAVTPHSFSDVLVSDFPEVINATRVFGGANNPIIVRYSDDAGNEKVFEENNFIAADSTFFDLFSFRAIKGDLNKALSLPQSVVITRDIEAKYFGESDPLGKTLNTDFGEFLVTGVIENIPENSHLTFDFVTSLRSLPFIFQNENFVSFTTHTYLKLKPETSAVQLESKFPGMVKRYAAPQIESNLNMSYEQYVSAGNGYNYTLIPLEDIHLHPIEYQGEFAAGGNIYDIYVFTSIALLILIIACINFMNLSTARSTERAKEVGIRKTLGSARGQLIGQFITESVIIALAATVMALVLVYLALPYFNTLLEKNLVLEISSANVLVVLLFAIMVGLLAGTYPAFVLSGFNPVRVLKGNILTNKNTAWFRNGLVVFQFAISIFLIAGTLIVWDQLTYIKSKDLGFDKDRVMILERANILDTQQKTFMDELRDLPQVLSVGGSGSLPVNQYFGIQFMPPGASEVLTVNAMQLDDHYSETMGFEIVQGRGFSENFNDSLSVVVNERTAELLGENPIGMKLTNTVPGDTPLIRKFEVIGVVRNFHYMTLRDAISPFVLMSDENGLNNVAFISIRIREGELSETIAAIESKWQEFVPQEPFKYSFLNEELTKQYKNEASSGSVLGLFSVLAIIIACVGLFGLASYMAGLRTKEIGVRKVMGASAASVVLLLSKDFSKLIVLAMFVAVPVVWYFMTQWLEAFAYKTSIGADVFIISGLSALIVAWLTTSYQAIKAATVNPVKSLRSE